MRLETSWKRAAVATLMLAAVGAGCGDDDDGGDARDGGADSGRAGTNGGGSGRTGAGTGGNNAGTAGSGGRMTIPMNMCDMTVEPETSCGGDDCPEISGEASACTVSCCVDDKCGTRNTGMLGARDCEVLGEADTRCPDYNGPSMGGGNVMRTGCCNPDGLCGVISSLSATCIIDSPYLDLPENPQRCDGTDADAGADPDGG